MPGNWEQLLLHQSIQIHTYWQCDLSKVAYTSPCLGVPLYEMGVLNRFSRVQPLVTLWTAGRQAPPDCHFLLQGIFPNQGSNLVMSLALAGRFSTTSATWEALSNGASQGCCED